MTVTTTRAGLLPALAPAAVYLAVRLLGVVVLSAMATRNGLVNELTSWDGQWLLGLARGGYDGVPPELTDARGVRTAETTMGFFPGYPATVALLGVVTGTVAAGLLVPVVAGVVAAYGLVRLGELVPGGSRRAGLLLVALFAATPMAVALSMSYTEALFCALAVWSLVGVLRRQWLLAGGCVALAGLVRPTASSLVVAVVLAAVLARRDGPRAWAGAALAGTGLAGYLGWVALRTGDPGGWARIQREGWGWYVDGGAATARHAAQVLDGEHVLFGLVTVAALVVSLVLLGLAVRARLPWPLIVYTVLVLVTTWGTAGLANAKLRLLIPAFVLLVPVALTLARRRTPVAVGVVAVLAAGSAWFGAYALTVWPYAI